MKSEKIGEWAFLACVVIAVLAGIGATVAGLTVATLTGEAWVSWLYLLLVILGVVVGVTTVTEKEITPFLVATIALIVTATAVFTPINLAIPLLGTLLDNIVKLVAVFVTPAAVILSIKAIYALASKK